jgi:ATP-dependent DNA helicase RecG
MDDVLRKIRLGEDSTFELKEVRIEAGRVRAPHRDALADEFAAFANARGGICILGVRDTDRAVVGIDLDDLDSTESFVREVITDSIVPPPVAHIERMEVPDAAGVARAVIVVEVPRSLFVHQSPGGYFTRLGSSKPKMSPDALARLFQQRSQARLVRFDEEVVPNATLADLNPALVDRFRSPLTEDDDPTLLMKLGMANRAPDGTVQPSAAGVLLGCDSPERFLRSAYIQAVAYRGTTVDPDAPRALYQLDARDITGPLDVQIVEACRFVQRNMKIGAMKYMGRVDVPQYDLRAVFEAVTNAVAHRDYSIYGSKIRLRMFDDRLEISSPGAIANSMTVASLPYRQAARNEAIASLLAKIRVPREDWLDSGRATLMDRRGEGVPIILQKSEALSGKRPVYEVFDDVELRLTIFAAGADGSA